MLNFQFSLFHDLYQIISSSKFHQKYFHIFDSLDLSDFPERKIFCGRKGYSKHSILKALIVKHIESINSIPALIRFLDSHPVLSEMCGFYNMKLPDSSVFYRFLSNTKNHLLKSIHFKINQELIDKKIICKDYFIIDSKPILAPTKENNIKNPNRKKSKNIKPKRNKDATFSYLCYEKLANNKRKTFFFWGYRTHVIITKEGIPILEETFPNNISDHKVAKKLFKRLKRLYKFKKGSIFVADSGYDVKDIYDLIINKYKSKAFIPINRRGTKEPKILSKNGIPLCDAHIEMKSNGYHIEPKRTRIKYRCPLKHNKKIARKFPNGCPVQHEKFTKGKQYGCTKYIDITNDARSSVIRDTDYYKKIYSTRQYVEQYFARLSNREFEQVSNYSFKVIRNHLTISHLSMSLIALAAVSMGRTNKIRCYKTFAA